MASLEDFHESWIQEFTKAWTIDDTKTKNLITDDEAKQLLSRLSIEIDELASVIAQGQHPLIDDHTTRVERSLGHLQSNEFQDFVSRKRRNLKKKVKALKAKGKSLAPSHEPDTVNEEIEKKFHDRKCQLKREENRKLWRQFERHKRRLISKHEQNLCCLNWMLKLRRARCRRKAKDASLLINIQRGAEEAGLAQKYLKRNRRALFSGKTKITKRFIAKFIKNYNEAPYDEWIERAKRLDIREEIREEWDSCIDLEGSAISETFMFPPAHPTPPWKKYRVDEEAK